MRRGRAEKGRIRAARSSDATAPWRRSEKNAHSEREREISEGGNRDKRATCCSKSKKGAEEEQKE